MHPQPTFDNPNRGWARDRRARATRHRVVITDAVRQSVATTLEDFAVAPLGLDPAPEASIDGHARMRAELVRMQARRRRMAAQVRFVREPEHHGALRSAILRLDACVLALERALPPLGLRPR